MAFLSYNQPCAEWHLRVGTWAAAVQMSSQPLSQGLLPGPSQLCCWRCWCLSPRCGAQCPC